MGGSFSKRESSIHDVNETNTKYVQQILDARKKLTGWERLKLMWQKDEFGAMSPEVQRIIHTACFSAVVGGIIGALGRGRIAHMNFLRSNAHEVFETPLQAKRKLQDSVTLGMFSGAWRIGWRITAFTTIYMAVSTAVSTYRGKMGILDQMTGAGVAGFMYKLPHGPKAQVAGTVAGSMLGLGAGIITLGITKLTGNNIDSANLRYYEYLAKQEQKASKADKDSLELLAKIDKPILPQDRSIAEFKDLSKFHEEMIAALEERRENETSNKDDSGNTNKTMVSNTESQSSSKDSSQKGISVVSTTSGGGDSKR